MSVDHTAEVWRYFRSWLRTMNPALPPSELIVANALRSTIPALFSVPSLAYDLAKLMTKDRRHDPASQPQPYDPVPSNLTFRIILFNSYGATMVSLIRLAAKVICLSASLLANLALGQSSFENPQPGSFQSGIGIISGWSCTGPISVIIDGAVYTPAYGTSRADAAGSCRGKADVGFGLLFNFNVLGAGNHTAQLRVNGANVGSELSFVVTVPVGEFAAGLNKSISVPDFPALGKTTQLVWQQAQQNFAIASVSGGPDASCYRKVFKSELGHNYTYNSFTQNGVTLAGMTSRADNKTSYFLDIAWSDAPFAENPFLVGRSTASLTPGAYG